MLDNLHRWIAVVQNKIDWKTAGLLLSSPLVRTAALLPVFGYLIIFSSEVQGWLDLGSLGKQFIFSHELKLRLVYYGGVLVILAYLLYALRCPELIKTYRKEDELHTAPTRVSASDDIDRIIKNWIEITKSDKMDDSLDMNFPEFAFGYCEQILRGSDRDFDRAVRRTDGLRFGRQGHRGPEHERAREPLSRFLRSYFDQIKDDDLRAEIPAETHAQAWNALGIVNQMARVSRISGSALEIAHIIYRIEFLRQRYSRRISAYFAVAFSGLGLLLTAAPAAETLVQIIIIDANDLANTGGTLSEAS